MEVINYFSQELFKQNSLFLRRFNILIDDSIFPMLLSSNDFIPEFSEDGYPILTTTSSSGTLTLASSISPLEEANNLVKDIKVSCNKLNVVGFGLGYHIEQIYMKISPNDLLKVYEPNLTLFLHTIALRDFSYLFSAKNFSLQLIKNEQIISTLEELSKDFDSGIDTFFHLPSIKSIKLPETRELIEEFYITYSTTKKFKDQIKNNIKENTKFIKKCKPVSLLFSTFQNTPAIIIAAGPSLDKNIKLLKGLESKIVLIAVDSALKICLDMQIKPNFVISSDPYENIPKLFFEGINSNIPLICMHYSAPKLIENYKGDKYIAFNDNSINSQAILETGETVVIAATDFAYKIGCNPIIFIGLDLCFPSELSHAKGCPVSKPVIPYTGSRIVESYDGKTITTTVAFYMMKKSLERYINKKLNEITFIDSTEGGVKIEGTKTIPLSETIENILKCKANNPYEINTREITS